MILLFTPRITGRLKYITQFILREICGFDLHITTSAEDFLNFTGARINYAPNNLPSGGLHIAPSGFLLQKGIRDFVPEVEMVNETPVLFPNTKNQDCQLGFDLFAASFYLISRYEEYLPYLEDRIGRFEPDQSLAFREGFLQKPLVDIWALQLREILLRSYPFLKYQARRFRFIPTYDIDIAYAFKGRGFARNILGGLRDLAHLDFSNVNLRFKVLTGQTKDPYDTYDHILHLHRKFKLDAIIFFLAADYAPYDKNISVYSPWFFQLVKRLGDYADTGIHPSFSSNFSEKKLAFEINRLSVIMNKPIKYSRQHYLKLKIPETYTRLIHQNISADFSMGYASRPGFRAGTCTPYKFYNVLQELETPLTVFPFTIMDGTLRDYQKLNPQQAWDQLKSLIDEVKQVDGTYISLWHNESLCDCNRWKGWKGLYEQMLTYIYQIKHEETP